MDIMGMMKKAQAMQAKMEEVQEELGGEVEGGRRRHGQGHAHRQGRAEGRVDRPVAADAGRQGDARGSDRRRPCQARAKADEALPRRCSALTAGLQLPPGMKLPF